jgi:hypothetical protein
MDVFVRTMESTVHAVQGESLLHESILNKITDHVCAKMTERLRHAHVVENERKMRANLTSEEISFWE